MNKRIIFLTSSIVGLACLLPAQLTRNPQITTDELRHHVRYLASDELEGRRAGSAGAEKAAAYLASEFKTYGLMPAGDNGTYLQQFDFVAGVRLTSNLASYTTQGRSTTLKVDQDYRPLGFSMSGEFSGEVVFAGYGISAPSLGYDDYARLDVKGKAVIVFRFTPKLDTLQREFTQFASLRYKASKAKELGATALIVVTGPEDSESDDLVRLSFDAAAGTADIVAVNFTRATVDQLLASGNTSLKELQNLIRNTRKPASRVLPGITLRVVAGLEEIRHTTHNVLGYLEGTDPTLKNEVIVVGAHYDHVGFGGEGSGSLRPDTTAIHNGADDNASGSSGLLELAQAFSARKNELKRGMLFIAFAAEELGLLGSGYYVKNPTVSLERLVTMINMDMIGRLDNRKLIVYGIGTSPGFESLVRKHNARPGADSLFALRLVPDGFGPSDHSSFYGKQIPVFHFFTDLHADYHRPSDDWDKINYDGMATVVRYVEAIAFELNTSALRPQYAAIEPPRPAGTGRSSGVYMGTIPDFGEQVEGVKLSGVREGSPAAKAGLQSGDIIVRFGNVEVKNLYDFTYALGEHKPGDEVDVVVQRGKDSKTAKVKLERRN